MTQGSGFPIYLVQSNGDKIPLMGESMVMSVDRTVGGVPLPFSENTRVGMDLNMATAALVIEGFFADDTTTSTTTIAAAEPKAKASINFSIGASGGEWWTGSPNYTRHNGETAPLDFAADTGNNWGASNPANNALRQVNGQDVFHQRLRFIDKDGGAHFIHLVAGVDFSSSSYAYADGNGHADDHLIGTAVKTYPVNAGFLGGLCKRWILVGIKGATTVAQITTKIASAINSTTHPSTLSEAERPGSHFVATTSNETSKGSHGVGGILNVEFKDTGAWGKGTPTWQNILNPSPPGIFGPLQEPDITTFTGGGSSISGPRPVTTTGAGGNDLSAGDKVYEIWALCNNMNNDGVADTASAVMAINQIMLRFATTPAFSIMLTLSLGMAGLGMLAATGGTLLTQNIMNNMQSRTDADSYITGIQVPYQSMVTAASGQKYTQRSFLAPTGNPVQFTNSASSYIHRLKRPENNVTAYDKEIDATDFTPTNFIKGTIKQFVVNYDAGESVYRYQLTFLPINFIV